MATVVFSDYSYESLFEPVGKSAGFTDSFHIDVFSANSDGSVGSKITSANAVSFIPWQPEATPAACSTAVAYKASDGFCYTGRTFTVGFSFDNVPVPDKIIFAVTYNTTAEGLNPIGTPGPYDKVDVGYTTSAPTIGSNPSPLISYLDLGSGLGAYDVPALEGYAVEASFSTVPEPSTFGFAAAALCCAAIGMRRRRAVAQSRL